MIKKNCIFTIVSKNYLRYAKTLLESIIETSTDCDFYLCLSDKHELEDEIFYKKGVYVVEAINIDLPNFFDMVTRYDVTSFNTAIKPFMFKWLFKNGYKNCVYLDPDIYVYKNLNHLFEKLELEHSALLTPHITQPYYDNCTPGHLDFLKSGLYNLGFIGLSLEKEDVMSFVEWWGNMLQTQCLVDYNKGLFYDQKWCDFIPSFIENVKIISNSGYNVAYWNISHRHLEICQNNLFTTNKDLLVFFHFSGLSEKNLISVHQNRYSTFPNFACKKIFSDYRLKLNKNAKNFRNLSYLYDKTPSGIVLSPIVRQAYRDNNIHPIHGSMKDIEEKLISTCRYVISSQGVLKYTSLMETVYNARPDLQIFFNLSNNGLKKYIKWFHSSGVLEYNIDRRLV